LKGGFDFVGGMGRINFGELETGRQFSGRVMLRVVPATAGAKKIRR